MHFRYLFILGCLLAVTSCKSSQAQPGGGSGGIKIDNIIHIGYLARSCGCALQTAQEWDRLSDRVVFLSSFETGVARMNFNGYDVEMRECQTVRPRGELRRGDHFFTDYRVTRILDRPGRGNPRDDDPRYRDQRDPGDDYPDLGPRYPEDDYQDLGPRNPRDDNRQREQQPDNRPPSDYGPQPGSIYIPGFRLQDEREYDRDRGYDRDRDRRPPRDKYPWPEYSDIDVRVEYFVVGRCRRWEDPRCRMNYVDAKIIIFKNRVQQHELKTIGTCGCI